MLTPKEDRILDQVSKQEREIFEALDLRAKLFDGKYPLAYRAVSRVVLGAARDIDGPLRVVDLGCGDGLVAGVLAGNHLGRYLGIDHVEGNLREVMQQFSSENGLICMTEQKWPDHLIWDENWKRISEKLEGSPNLIVCYAAFTDAAEKAADYTRVLSYAVEQLPKGGRVVLGAYSVNPDDETVREIDTVIGECGLTKLSSQSCLASAGSGIHYIITDSAKR